MSQIVKSNISAVLRILSSNKEYTGKIFFDEFQQKIFHTIHGVKKEWSDIDTIDLTAKLQQKHKLSFVSDRTVFKAVLLHANRNSQDEARTWLKNLRWDNVKRVESFFHSCFGAEDNGYNRAVSKSLFLSMVARVLVPGCKVDTMIVLEGAQGRQKSLALEKLGGEWYSQIGADIRSKDFPILIQGRLIVEVSEMASFKRADVEAVKKTLSCAIDRLRMPYDRMAKNLPRRGVLVGTTNDSHYLADLTGNRRFLPIEVKNVKLDLIEKYRDQLFAEACSMFEAGEKWWNLPMVETKLEQERRRAKDPWEDPMAAWLSKRSKCTAKEVLETCLKIEIKDQTRAHEMKVTSILKYFGWVAYQEGTARTRIWRKEQPEQPF